MEKQYNHIGHPKGRIVGPLELGWHKWFSEEGKLIGLSAVTSSGEELIGLVGSEEDRRMRFAEFCRAVESGVRRSRKFGCEYKPVQLLGTIDPTPY